MNNALITVPNFHILIESPLQPSNMKGVKQLAIRIWGYFLIHLTNFVPLPTNLIRLIIKEIKTGVKYANSRYSAGIMGSIVLSTAWSMPLWSIRIKEYWYLYEVKNDFSMHKILAINMVLSNKVHAKGNDIIPPIGALLERMGIGPLRKKLVMPKEPEIVLIIKEIIGIAWSRLAKYGIV